jgi:hypothetical protein
MRHFCTFIAVMVVWLPCCGLTQMSTRMLGTAGGLSANVPGFDAVYGNPALTGWPYRGAGEVQIRLVDGRLGVRNNSWSWNDFDKYSAEDLTAAGRREMLDKIPHTGWEVTSSATANVLGMRFNNLAIFADGSLLADFKIDKRTLELLFLEDQELGEFTLLEKSSEVMTEGRFGLAYGTRLTRIGDNDVFVGVSLSKLFGALYVKTLPANVWLSAFTDAAYSDSATFTLETAEGGSGWRLDAGVAIGFAERWTFSLAAENFIHKITWNEKTYRRTWTIKADNLFFDNLGDIGVTDDMDSSSTRVPIPSFTTTVPMNLKVGIGYNGEESSIAVMATMGTKDRFYVSTKPSLAVGVEWRFFPLIPLRAGYILGGGSEPRIGLGTGLWLGFLHFDFGILAEDPLNYKSGKGVSLGAAIELL